MGLSDGPAEGGRVGLVDGTSVGVDVNPIIMMLTGYGEDVAFESVSSGRKCTVTTSPTVDKEVATASLISIQSVVS